MDSRDLIIGGAVVVGGYFAWKWWTNRPVTNAAQSKSDNSGRVASSMTETASRTTVFGGGTMLRRLLSPPTVPLKLPGQISPTAGPSGLVARQAASQADVTATVLRATLAPLPVAPSPNGFLITGPSIMAPLGTAPAGDLPTPGDPNVSQLTRPSSTWKVFA